MKKQACGISRRQALKARIAGGTVVASASQVGEANAESKEVTPAVKVEGYKETDHTRAYYASL
ncbi:MAG: formate dehydrogenase [Shewanella sp.]|nr:formate dehydrogenase [Shewanella sp.]MCF1456728.1 formate dehydrogenase [Shewanella sp.]